MTDRRWFNVGAVKLPEAERNVAASVFASHPERFYDIVGADTPEDDERFPVGSHTTYSAHLTEREAERFARASNARYVEPDGYTTQPRAGTEVYLPRPNAQRYMQGEVAAYPSLTGTGFLIGQLDEGTTIAARGAKNIALQNRGMFTTGGDPSGEIWPGLVHGCLVMGNAVPYNGTVVDAFVINSDGGCTDSNVASAITWLVTQGARLVNGSIVLGGSPSAVSDAITAASSSDVAFFFAAGNENLRNARFPASMNQYTTYVHSIMSIDMSNGQRSSFSNYGPWHTGIAPGELVYTTNYDGTAVEWAGTSAATPHVVQLAARIMSAGVSAKQAAAALKATVRDIGLGADNQGGGLYSMQAALRWLGKEPAIVVTTPARPQKPGLPL